MYSDRETAFEKSIDSIIACAWGERGSFICSMRGRTMSSAKARLAGDLARPSTLRRRFTDDFHVPACAAILDRLEDLLIPGAAERLPENGFLVSFPVGHPFAVEERFSPSSAIPGVQ